jgi:hypothetical protein
LKAQLSQQEISKRAQGEELEGLKVQLENLKKEEREYKHRVRRRNSWLVFHDVCVCVCVCVLGGVREGRA